MSDSSKLGRRIVIGAISATLMLSVCGLLLSSKSVKAFLEEQGDGG